MKIIQTVIVKQVLTETSREKLLNKYEAKKFQLRKENEQFKFEMKKQEKAKKIPFEVLKKRFDHEIRGRDEKIDLLDFQIEQLHMLPLGSELKDSEVQAIVDINEGDSWDDFSEKTIVIKDGVVFEIRER